MHLTDQTDHTSATGAFPKANSAAPSRPLRLLLKLSIHADRTARARSAIFPPLVPSSRGCQF